jgi:hypothetical protein
VAIQVVYQLWQRWTKKPGGNACTKKAQGAKPLQREGDIPPPREWKQVSRPLDDILFNRFIFVIASI